MRFKQRLNIATELDFDWNVGPSVGEWERYNKGDGNQLRGFHEILQSCYEI
jgi:hypothetical protein